MFVLWLATTLVLIAKSISQTSVLNVSEVIFSMPLPTLVQKIYPAMITRLASIVQGSTSSTMAHVQLVMCLHQAVKNVLPLMPPFVLNVKWGIICQPVPVKLVQVTVNTAHQVLSVTDALMDTSWTHF